MDNSGSSRSCTLAKNLDTNETSRVEERSRLEGDLRHGSAERIPQSALDQDQKVKEDHFPDMIDEPVRIWLGTQDIPPIQVWAPRLMDEQDMLSLPNLTLGVTTEKCWSGDSTLSLKGGEEFIISRNGYLHSGFLDTCDAILDKDHHIRHAYLDTWETSTVQGQADDQAELAAQNEVIMNEETERYELNESDGYCR
jgi:hypothetical protein